MSTTILIYHIIELYINTKDLLKINFLSHILLLFFMNIHSILFLTQPNWLKNYQNFYKKYFLLNIDKRVANIVSTASILVTIGIISIIILFVDVKKKVERYAFWEIQENKFFQTRKIIFRFRDYPGNLIEFSSNNLSEKLKNVNKKEVPMLLEFNLDFGKIKGYKVLSLDGEKPEKYGFYLFSFNCPSNSIECPGIPLWEEK